MREHLEERLKASAIRVSNYLESQMTEEGSYGKFVTDISCYCKSPFLFILSGKNECAEKMLKFIQHEFMNDQGDFQTSFFVKSTNPLYEEFSSYVNGWIVRAAQYLKMNSITDNGMDYLSRFKAKGVDNGYHTHPSDTGDECTDVLTTTHLGLINLEAGDLTAANSAGNYLCNIYNSQPNLNHGFYLRFHNSVDPVFDFKSKENNLYFIDKNKPDQLYFMIGYPAAYLATLYKRTGNKKFLEGAKSYLDFALSCNNPLHQSESSHQIAWAASILYSITGEVKYLTVIQTITDFLLNLQENSGMWFELDIDRNKLYDQSTEIACCFLEMHNNLKKADKNHSHNSSDIAPPDSQSQWSETLKCGAIIALTGGLGLLVYKAGVSKGKNLSSDPDKQMKP